MFYEKPVVTYWFIRHGNTGQAATDSERRLTEVGHQQCEALRESLSVEFDLVLSSTMDRAAQTASLVSGKPPGEIQRLEILFQHDDAAAQAEIMEMFSKLGYATLAPL